MCKPHLQYHTVLLSSYLLTDCFQNCHLRVYNICHPEGLEVVKLVLKLYISLFCSSRGRYLSLVWNTVSIFQQNFLPFCKQNVVTYLLLKTVEKFKEDMSALGRRMETYSCLILRKTPSKGKGNCFIANLRSSSCGLCLAPDEISNRTLIN